MQVWLIMVHKILRLSHRSQFITFIYIHVHTLNKNAFARHKICKKIIPFTFQNERVLIISFMLRITFQDDIE